MMNRQVLYSPLTGLALALVTGLAALTPAAGRLENQYALGLLYALRPAIAPPAGATVIGIDRQTMTWLREPGADAEKARLMQCLPASARGNLDQIRGPGSLPRSVHACLLVELKRLGFSVVVFDILFGVPGDAEDDRKFAAALREHGAAVILVGIERSIARDGAAEILIEREMKPLDLFGQSAASTGAFIVPRSGGPVYGYWPRLAGFPATGSLPEEALRIGAARAAPAKDATAPFKYLWIYGPPGTIPTVSMRDLLRGAAGAWPGSGSSVAFVGASDPTATNFPDSFPSFIQGGNGANISGVELTATAYLNLLHGDSIRRLTSGQSQALIMAYAFALGFLARAKPNLAMIAALATAVAYLAAAAAAFAEARIFLPVAVPLFIVAPAAFLLAVVIKYRFARSMIMHMTPAPVARRMLAQSSDERASAVSDEATVVFIDLIGSTAIAETLTALAYSALLNSYHEVVTRVVSRHRGFVIAFAGDGIMAAFSGRDAGADHAARACESLLEIIRDIRNLNQANAAAAVPPLSLRIGMNSGTVAEGDIGSHDRFNFSVVGDVVNLASRLEQLGKTLFPGEQDVILLGQSTMKLAAGGGFSFLDCGPRSIPGRERPETVYRLKIV